MEQLLSTKIFIPPRIPTHVLRFRLLKSLDQVLHKKIFLLSAPAGFGKTTLVSDWIDQRDVKAAWLSLDNGENDLIQFIKYLVFSLRLLFPEIGEQVIRMTQSSQLPPVETIMTTLINEVLQFQTEFVLVLDDYHVIDDSDVDDALSFLVDNLPANMHLIMTTREDPQLPLARLRARNQLGELRVADLRFNLNESTEFLNEKMQLRIPKSEISMLETRTEGWIAGLQLAAISLQSHDDMSEFIQSFSGSHQFVMDFLVEEVLNYQSEKIQEFLLKTSILDRMNGELIDAIISDQSVSSQQILEYLYQVNLFIIPLDNERNWYRYHHLFLDLLRKRLSERYGKTSEVETSAIDELHRKASRWFEQNGFLIEAFQHAVAANDIDLAEHLLTGKGTPMQYRGVMLPVVQWLSTLAAETLNARPLLLVTYASTLTVMGKPIENIESILQIAENKLRESRENQTTRDAIGQIAAIRSMLAIPQNQIDEVIKEANQALKYLNPENLSARTNVSWVLGYVNQFQGKLRNAEKAYRQAFTVSQNSRNIVMSIATKIGLGQISECLAQLNQAGNHYKEVLEIAGSPPLPYACEAYIGLARIAYEHNNLDEVEPLALQSIKLAQQLPNVSTPITGYLVLSWLNLAKGDLDGVAEAIREAELFADQNNFDQRVPEIVTHKIRYFLRKGDHAQAELLAQKYNLPISLARTKIEIGDFEEALLIIKAHRMQVEKTEQKHELLETLIIEGVSEFGLGNLMDAKSTLNKVLNIAKPGKYVRLFLDEGQKMHTFLKGVQVESDLQSYQSKLIRVFEKEFYEKKTIGHKPEDQLIELLSAREREILQLIGQGCSNLDISNKLYIALDTVKGHNRNIFGKLNVKNRTEAVAKARELGVI